MNRDKSLCIIPCGAAKIWDKQPSIGPVEAQNVYTGVFAVACQRYAKTFFDHWVILSAKYGFLFPEDMIPEDYNVSFIKPSSETILIAQLKEQAESKGLFKYQEITVLGGKHYADRAKAVFNQGQELFFPLSDCTGIGYMLQRLTRALEGHEEISGDSLESPSEVNVRPTLKKHRDQPKNLMENNVGKYVSLYRYLLSTEGKQVIMTIGQIETVLGFALPASASKYRPWWANALTNTQAKSWLLAGWEVDSVTLGEKTAFRKIGDEV
ncbi:MULTISPECIES: DUF6884 domain-containing protein [unclassified Paenibacillus]|uniref:DUF7662 domain-containing protein n=2 Tax=Paenibacillus TaxID=44249 RepID=UPI000970001A|nr:DUF6884 domain-containing protein [Paenibacillus sp. FSL H8-0259]OMF33377.1 hypothetical protein BK132_04015 [Paenibacillus sp. FSL H8-0259]